MTQSNDSFFSGETGYVTVDSFSLFNHDPLSHEPLPLQRGAGQRTLPGAAAVASSPPRVVGTGSHSSLAKGGHQRLGHHGSLCPVS